MFNFADTDVENYQQAIDALNDQRAKEQGLAPYARMEYGALIGKAYHGAIVHK